MWTQRSGRSAPDSPATSSSPQSETRSPTVSIAPSLGPQAGLDALARLGQHRPQHRLDLLELLAVADQRRRELNDRVPTVIGAADEAAAGEPAGEETAQQRLGLRIRETLLGLL